MGASSKHRNHKGRRPSKCPSCGSPKVEEDDVVDVNKQKCMQSCRCRQCHCEWSLTFIFHGWDFRGGHK